jgi:hypothetical protein
MDKTATRIVIACGALICVALISLQLYSRSVEHVNYSQGLRDFSGPGLTYSDCTEVAQNLQVQPASKAGTLKFMTDYEFRLYLSLTAQHNTCGSWLRTAFLELFIVLVAAVGLLVVNERRIQMVKMSAADENR